VPPKPGHGAAQVAAWVFQFALVNEIESICKIERIGAKRMRCDLAVKDAARDIGVIG
jgi:hypothetical protein